jgi:hypothetical protein
LTIAALNDLEIIGADVQNAFLTSPNKEKCWMVAGPEFGSEEGKNFLVVKALVWPQIRQLQLQVLYGGETCINEFPIFNDRS